jgi:hypothetical protein
VPFARITGHGLVGIAISVVLLWACALTKLVIIRGADADAEQAVQAMRLLRLKNRRPPASFPVSAPRPALRRPVG